MLLEPWTQSLEKGWDSRSVRRWSWLDAWSLAILRSYQTEHRKLALRPLCMARLMLTLDQRPWLQQRTLQVFQRRPEIFPSIPRTCM
jgi:hypothetical protein